MDQQQLLVKTLQSFIVEPRALQELLKAYTNLEGTAHMPTLTSFSEQAVDATKQAPPPTLSRSCPAIVPQVAVNYQAEMLTLDCKRAEISQCLEVSENAIKQNEAEIEMLTKKRNNVWLQQVAKKSEENEENMELEEHTTSPLSISQIFLEKGRKRKADYETSIKPIYHELSDVPGMRELAIRHKSFAPKLCSYLRMKRLQKERNNADWEVDYKRKYDDWSQKLQQHPWEANYKKKYDQCFQKAQKQQKDAEQQAKEARWRTIFELTFKELSRERDEKERQSRIENRGSGYLAVTSEGANEEKQKTNAAVIPPLLKSGIANKTNCVFPNRNQLKDNVALQEQRRISDFLSSWTEQDLAIFRSRLKLVGKNFANIAMCFPEKSVGNCVQCYYLLIKNDEDYKSVLARTKRYKKYKAPGLPTVAELSKYPRCPRMAIKSRVPVTVNSNKSTEIFSGDGPVLLRLQHRQKLSHDIKEAKARETFCVQRMALVQQELTQITACVTQIQQACHAGFLMAYPNYQHVLALNFMHRSQLQAKYANLQAELKVAINERRKLSNQLELIEVKR